MKKYLITASEQYYPDHGPGDWIKTFSTLNEAKEYAGISISENGNYFDNKHYWCFSKGFTLKLKDKDIDYIFIIDLEKWME